MTTLRFGKYKSRDIEEVFRIDPSYARWLYNQDVLVSKSEEIQKFLESKFRGTEDNSSQLTFGRHKGKTLGWVRENDTKYIDYLRANEFVQRSMPSLAAELKKLP